MIKAIGFDMDGVLVDTMKNHARAWQQTFLEHKYKIEEQLIFQLEGMNGPKTIDWLNDHYSFSLSTEAKQLIYNRKRLLFKEINVLSFFEDTIDTIRYIQKQGLKTALITGSNREFAEEVLKSKNLTFDAVITGSDVKNGKPHPEPYQRAMEALMIDPKEWLIVENAPLGITAAKKAGAKVLAVETSLPKQYLTHADHIIPFPALLKEEIINWINERERL
ncbi:HAD family hydrolase [Bacillus taeanensis]|nr:HAD family phosphatase [Bacillus taeanensis]